MSQIMEVSKEGIKLPYLRFLSDSAPGYIFLLIIGVGYVLKLPLPFVGSSWLNIIPVGLSTETKVFLFFLFFLIATPIGLILNSLGWFFLGTLLAWSVRLWRRLPKAFTRGRLIVPNPFTFPIAASRRALLVDDFVSFFSLDHSPIPPTLRLYEQANYYEELLSIYYPAYYERLEHIRGTRRLCRSLAFLALTTSFYCYFTVGDWHQALLAMGCFVFAIIICSLIEYYQCLQTLFMVYILSVGIEVSDNQNGVPTRKEIAKNLIKSSAKESSKTLLMPNQ